MTPLWALGKTILCVDRVGCPPGRGGAVAGLGIFIGWVVTAPEASAPEVKRFDVVVGLAPGKGAEPGGD
jgi:hypothetical protein